MIQEPFAHGQSVIHRLDPRIKVIFATLYSFTVALSSAFPALLAALFFSAFLTFLANLDIRKLGTRMMAMNLFILFLWLAVPVTFGGEDLFPVGPFAVSREGVILCARITVKSNAILLAFISLVATMSIATLGHALDLLGIPGKMVQLLLLSYRYLFVIDQESRKLFRAAKIRSFRPGTNMHTYRTYAYFIGMLFVRAYARAERVQQAMICRGFSGKFYCLRDFSFSRLDWIWATVLGFAIIGLGLLEWMKATW